MIAVCGQNVYRVDVNFSKTLIGSLGNNSGPVWFADNGSFLIISDGNNGYLYSSSGLTKLASSDLGTLSAQDAYFCFSPDGSQVLYVATYDDSSGFTELGFGIAQGIGDDLVAVIHNLRRLWLFGAESTELWYDSGNADFPFERYQGAFLDMGLAAKASLARISGSIFGLNNRREVFMTQGFSYKIISTPGLAAKFAGYSRVDDARGFEVRHRGRSWYVLHFPTADKTWVYDILTTRWFQWSSGTSEGRHRSNCYAFFNGYDLVGDYERGQLYALDADVYTDDGDEIRSVHVFDMGRATRNYVFFNRVEIEFDAGVGQIGGHGIDSSESPKAILQWSDDKGRNWSNEHPADIGKIGEYGARQIWFRLGASRDRLGKVIVTDAVPRVMYAAYIDAIGGTH